MFRRESFSAKAFSMKSWRFDATTLPEQPDHHTPPTTTFYRSARAPVGARRSRRDEILLLKP